MRAGLEEVLFKKYSNNNKSIKNNVADDNKTNNKYDLLFFLIQISGTFPENGSILLVEPILKEGYDMTRGCYDRHPRDGVCNKTHCKTHA